MSNDYVIAVEGLADLRDIDNLDEAIVVAARQAINKAADRGRTRADREIRQQVNFPARYLSERLKVTRRASGRSLEATITGRDRPTSLARFATSSNVAASQKRGNVTVAVSPGARKVVGRKAGGSGPTAFLMQLRGGNVGLAMRLKEGETVRNKKYMTKVGKGLYLLYGPSVNQVFRSVAEEQTVPETAAFLEQEFLRLLDL
jgi:hypothetical protein